MNPKKIKMLILNTLNKNKCWTVMYIYTVYILIVVYL